MGVDSTKYEARLRFYMGASNLICTFPVGEKTYSAKIKPGEEVSLPHQKHPFFYDLPRATVESIQPSMLGEIPIVLMRICLPAQQAVIPVITSLFHWYQNRNQLEFSFPGYSYASTYMQQRTSLDHRELSQPTPVWNYETMMRRAIQKVHDREQRHPNLSHNLINSTSLLRTCQTNQRGRMQSASLSGCSQSMAGEH